MLNSPRIPGAVEASEFDSAPAAREALFKEGYDPSFGARPLKRAIQKLIADPLALKILSGEIQPGEHLEADASKTGDLTFRSTAAKAS